MLLLNTPRTIIPKTEPYGGILVLDPEGSSSDASGGSPVLKLIQDPNGKDIGHFTGIAVHENKLYLGSLKNDFVGVYDMSDMKL